MKTLIRGSAGTEVRILQGWLNVLGYYNGVIDGSYGDVTELAVRDYQGAHNLSIDGSCGTITQKEMGFLPVKNSKIMVLRIPFTIVEKAGVLLKDKQAYSVEKLAKEFNYNVVVNGGFFDTKTRQNTTDLIVAGKINNGGNYTDKGLVFSKDFKGAGIYPSTTFNSIGKNVDFMGGCPTLIQNGIKAVDMKGIGSGVYTQVTRRTCTGVTKDAFYILMSLKNCNLEEMVQEGLNQKLLFLKGNDGGGSQSMYLGKSTVVYTDGRSIPSAEGLYVKKEDITGTLPTPPKESTKPAQTKYRVVLDSGHSSVVAGKRSPDNTLLEYEFNMDVCRKIQFHLNRHDVESKIIQVENTNLTQELNERVAQNNAYKPDVSVSIHANAFGDGKTFNDANGWEIYYSLGSVNGKKLAQAIHAESIPYLKLRDRGIKTTTGFVIVRKPTAPSVLIENGFYTNKSDIALLKTQEFREKCAVATSKGILKYLGVNWNDVIEVDVSKEDVEKNDVLHKVQVGAFANRDNAERLKAELESKGYSTVIKKEER